MSTGMSLPVLANLMVSVTENLTIGYQNPERGVVVSGGPWTPPQYSQPALTVLTVVYPPYSVNSSQSSAIRTDYVFDAVLRILHNRRLRKTSHPVLTGANISDHAYIEPARVTLEIGMSDSMSSFTNSMWTGISSTKSVSAWKKIKDFQTGKVLITLTSRLDTYERMMVIDATSPDDNRTRHGLKATIVLEELLSASVMSTKASSARSDSTDSSPNGVVQAIPPNQSQVDNHSIPSPLYPGITANSSVPGAGTIGSTSLSKEHLSY
jgi:hypothetical protein